jgi:hypothetical protein
MTQAILLLRYIASRGLRCHSDPEAEFWHALWYAAHSHLRATLGKDPTLHLLIGHSGIGVSELS